MFNKDKWEEITILMEGAPMSNYLPMARGFYFWLLCQKTIQENFKFN